MSAPPFESKSEEPKRISTPKPRRKSSAQSGGAFLGAIALAVLTLFSAGVGVFSYLRGEEAESRLLAFIKLHQEADADRMKLKDAVAQLAIKLGRPGVADPNALLKSVQEDIHRNGSQDNYPAQVGMLLEKIKTERFRAELAEEATVKQRKIAEMTRPNFDAQLAALQAVIDRQKNELLDDRETSHGLLGVLERQIADLQEQLANANTKLRQTARDREVESGKADQKIKSLAAAVRGMKEEKNAEENEVEQIRKEAAAGIVAAVDSASKLVTLNVGRGQGLRAGMLFRIFRPDALGHPKEEVAVLEVVRMDERSSTCQIRKNDVRQPILTGDLAFNPLLGGGKGKGEVVALVGKLDIDEDGEDDADAIERLVKEQGGRVEYRLYPDGRERGKITPRVTWVVMDMPKVIAASAAERDIVQRYSAVRKEAVDFGIPILDSRKFAKEIGYRLDLNKTSRP